MSWKLIVRFEVVLGKGLPSLPRIGREIGDWGYWLVRVGAFEWVIVHASNHRGLLVTQYILENKCIL